jgi:hypothetical protein
MQARQRESALMVMVVTATVAVLLALLAGAGIWFLRKRNARQVAGPVEHDPLPGSPAAEA